MKMKNENEKRNEQRTPVDEAYHAEPPHQLTVDAINEAMLAREPPELHEPLAAEIEVRLGRRDREVLKG